MDDNMIFYHDPAIGPNQAVSQSLFETSWENLRNRMITIWPKKEMSKKKNMKGWLFATGQCQPKTKPEKLLSQNLVAPLRLRQLQQLRDFILDHFVPSVASLSFLVFQGLAVVSYYRHLR